MMLSCSINTTVQFPDLYSWNSHVDSTHCNPTTDCFHDNYGETDI